MSESPDSETAIIARPADLEGLRERALAAIPCGRLSGDPDPEWAPYFTMHGDPFVVERSRGRWAQVAEVSTAPEDYGKARAEFIGSLGPAAVLRILDYIEGLENGRGGA